MDRETMENDTVIVFLKDAAGRELECSVEYSFTHEEEDYLVLLPKDTPVEIFVWKVSGDEEELVPLEENSQIDEELFELAKAVLAEQNLTLKRTGVTLTVEGEIPEMDEEDEEMEEDLEPFQLLATFYFGGEEYEVSTPLDPLFLLARMTAPGQAKELSAEELKKIEHLLPKIEQELERQFLDPLE